MKPVIGITVFHIFLSEIFPAGCACFSRVSPNVALEESSIKSDQETGDEQTFSEVMLLMACVHVHTRRWPVEVENVHTVLELSHLAAIERNMLIVH